MEILMRLLLPSLILPLVLSLSAWQLTQRHTSLQSLRPLIWMPSFLWIAGLPSLPPEEAIDWLSIVLVLAVIINRLLASNPTGLPAMQTMLLALALTVTAWPIFKFEFSLTLLLSSLRNL